MKTPILGGYAVARSVNAADNRIINLYPEATPEGGKTSGFLTRCPGYKLLINSIGDGPIRGLWQFGGYMYVVSDVTLYKVDNEWGVTQIGTVSGSGPVSMSDNGAQLFIACNPRGYTYSSVSNTFAEITDPDFPGAVTVGFINGYFVFNEPDSQKLWITSYQDGSSIDPLEFAYADASPDLLLSLVVNRNEIWLFGSTSTEVWYYSGNVQFPLDRIQGAFNEVGCAAPYSVAKLDNTLYWLGSDPRGNCIVYKAVGYGADRVSTHGLEKVLQSYSYVGDAIGYSYQQEGHTFYVLLFPSANATWCYDAATQEWHERGSWVNGAYNRHRSNCQANFNNKIVLGDFEYGKLFEFSTDYYEDDIGIQRCLRSWRALPPNQNNLTRTAHHSLQLDAETGTKTWILSIISKLDPNTANILGYLSNDDMVWNWNYIGSNGCAYSTISQSSRKYYFEAINKVAGGYGYATYDNWAFSAGLSATRDPANDVWPGSNADSWGFLNANISGFSTDTSLRHNNVVTYLTGVSQVPQGGYLGVAVDFDAGKIWFNANGTWILNGDPATGANPAYTFTPHTELYAAFGAGSYDPFSSIEAAFNRTKFLGTIPDGFYEWDGALIKSPKMLLRWSDDGGHTWSNYYEKEMGTLGEYGTRMIWRRLGMTTKIRDRVYEVSVSDPVKVTIVAAELNLSETTA